MGILETVNWFATLMVYKLKKNRHKVGWEYMVPFEQLARMRDELEEIEEALINQESGKRIASECADLANFAMMLAANVRGKK